jgi:hypothetical protein
MRSLFLFLVLTSGFNISSATFAKTLVLKDFRQMLISLSVTTGVNHRDTDIQAIYQRVRTRLPLAGAVDEMSSPMILAVTELAGAFCDKMIKSDAEVDDRSLRRVHTQVEFRRGPSGLTDAILAATAREYAELFWQRPATATEARMLEEALQTARTQATGMSAAETVEVLKVGCAIAATSLAALLN